MPVAELLVAAFPPEAPLEGAVAGAIERMEATGEPRLLDALFVGRDADSGELYALDLATGLAHGTVMGLLEFRLEAGERRRLTQRTLEGHAGGVPADVIRTLGERLGAGQAALAALVAGGDPRDLTEAVTRSRGRIVLRQRVEGARLADVSERLLEVG
jgi:hypothetical protein